MSKRESKATGNPMMRSAIFSIVLSVLLVIILAALGGLLMLNGVLPESANKIWAIAAVFLACFIGPMPLLRTQGAKKLPMAYAVFGALMVLILLTKWIVWPDDNFTNWWVLLSGFLGATLAGVLRAGKSKRKRY